MGVNVDVVDFGADPTGNADSADAFEAAIASFSPPESQAAGIVRIPPGVYRLARKVSIKKSVWLQGSQGRSFALGCQIKPDPGVTAFIIEDDNRNNPTPDVGIADGAMISNLTIYNPNHKVDVWKAGNPYSVGDRIKVGPPLKQGAILLGNSWYRHYECTESGISSDSGPGPQSLGNDALFAFKNQTANFTLGMRVYGAASKASGIIIAITDNGAMGTLRLTSVQGTFLNNEIIQDRPEDSPNAPAVKFAEADGTQTAATDYETDGTVKWKYLGSGAGIRIRGNGCTIRDVTVQEMSGSGIEIVAQDLEVFNLGVNANGWMLRNVDIFKCDGHGLFVDGSDTNGGAFFGGVLIGNGGPASDEDFTGPGFNIYDSSFLGNTYIQTQFGGGGQGAFFTDCVGGGCTFVGCYQEGSGGGANIATGSCTVIGGGLSTAPVLGSGAPDWFNGAATTLGPAKSSGLQAQVSGWSAPPWRKEVWVPLGYRRQNPYPGGNIYKVTKAGITASSGGPTGTGNKIVDGTAEWEFVKKHTPDGQITLGSKEPQYKIFFSTMAPDDISIGLPTYFQHADFPGVTGAQGFIYGISGAGGESGAGMMHSVNDTTLTEWPMHIPAGRALFDYVWIGGCRVTFGTGRPTVGTWNKGDRIYFKGSAVSPGGAEGLVCVEEGTMGTYSGNRTASANGTETITLSGDTMSTLNDQKDFKVGDVLTINGITTRVTSVSLDGLSITLSGPIPADTGLPIAFRNPTFVEFGRIGPT